MAWWPAPTEPAGASTTTARTTTRAGVAAAPWMVPVALAAGLDDDDGHDSTDDDGRHRDGDSDKHDRDADDHRGDVLCDAAVGARGVDQLSPPVTTPAVVPGQTTSPSAPLAPGPAAARLPAAVVYGLGTFRDVFVTDDERVRLRTFPGPLAPLSGLTWVRIGAGSSGKCALG